MRLRKLVCLGGGLVCFGSSSRQTSEADRSSKLCVDDLTQKDARPRQGNYHNRGERLAAHFSVETRWQWIMYLAFYPSYDIQSYLACCSPVLLVCVFFAVYLVLLRILLTTVCSNSKNVDPRQLCSRKNAFVPIQSRVKQSVTEMPSRPVPSSVFFSVKAQSIPTIQPGHERNHPNICRDPVPP